MKLKLVFPSILALLLPLSSFAANDEFQLNGYLDFYYLSSPQAHRVDPAATSGPEVVNGSYFDRHANQMTLNMAELSLKKSVGKVSLKMDLAFGEMVDQLSGGSSQSVSATNPTNPAANEPTRNITHAILNYTVSDRLNISAGKFYTHMGYEVTKAKDNLQYSRGYIFNYGIPFWHEGINLNYLIIPGKLSSTFYVLNAWDGRVSQEQNKSSTIGLNLNFSGISDLVLNYNFIGGAESSVKGQRQVHEINASYKFSDKYLAAFDYVSGSQNDVPAIGTARWSGYAIYLKAQVNDVYSISPRYEVFDDSDQGFAISGGLTAAGVKQKIESLTLANNFNLGDGLESRFEIRSDKSDSKGYFLDKDLSPAETQQSYTLALLYSF